jgi:uncharacterized protein
MGKVENLARRKGPNCPICGKPSAGRHRPFCSRRCADIDLGRWLGGIYRIETEETPKTEDGRTAAAEEEDKG